MELKNIKIVKLKKNQKIKVDEMYCINSGIDIYNEKHVGKCLIEINKIMSENLEIKSILFILSHLQLFVIDKLNLSPSITKIYLKFYNTIKNDDPLINSLLSPDKFIKDFDERYEYLKIPFNCKIIILDDIF